jgi:hypothetical protein
MEIIQTTLAEVFENYPACKNLSYGISGGMSMLYTRVTGRKLKATQAFVAIEDGSPIGWAWAIPTKVYGKRSFVSFSYVESARRGEGFGLSLYRAVRKFATSKHRSIFLDHQASAIKIKNKCNTWGQAQVMKSLYDKPQRRIW